MHYRYLRQKASASRKKDFREAEEAVLQVVEFEDGALGAGGGDLAVKAQPAFLNLGSGRFQAFRRASISSWGTIRSSRRLSISMTIRSHHG